MSPKDKETFLAWHASKKESNYVLNFKVTLDDEQGNGRFDIAKRIFPKILSNFM